MSTRSILEDSRYNLSAPQGGTLKVGRYFSLNSSGANRAVGEPVGTPHNYDLTLIDKQTGYLAFTVKKPGDWYCGYNTSEVWTACTCTAGMSSSWNSNDEITLLGKLADKYDDGSFNAPVFVGELGESVDMLAGHLRRLAQAGKLVKHGNIVGALKVLGHEPRRSYQRKSERQSISNNWLEISYGWRPLISDIFSLSDAIQKRDKPRTKTITVKHSKPYDSFVASYTGYSATGEGRYGKQIIAHIEEVQPTLADRMGLRDPASIVWELLPFSFVADWALPIGDYLRARNTVSRVKGTFVITTRDKYHVRYGSRQVKRDDGCLLWPDGPAMISWEKKVVLSRRVQSSLSSPDLPRFKNPLGPEKHVYDALALVTSIFGKRIGT